MAEKISQYTADAVSDPIKTTDLLDFSNWDGVSAFDVSKKITVAEMTTYLNTVVATMYTANGTTPPALAVGITDTIDFGTSLFSIDETNGTVNAGFGMMLVDKTNGTINIKGAIDNTVRLTLRGLGATNATTSVLVEDSATSEMFSINDAGDVSSRDGYFIGTDLFVHIPSTNSTMVGVDAGEVMTGISNSGFGLWALKLNSTGTKNAAFGTQALSTVTIGSECSAFGNTALILSTGSFNSAFGAKSLSVLQTGTHNIAFGNSSGNNVNGASIGNTFLGSVTGATVLGAYSHSIALGRNALIDSSNQMVVGASQSSAYINESIWGSGIEAATITPTSFTMGITNITDLSGTDIASGYDYRFRTSAGLGTGLGGKFIWQTAPATTTGTSQNAFVDALIIEESGVTVFKSFTLATLPTVVAGGQIYVSDATGSGVTGSLCFGNGTSWIDPTTGIAVA